MEGLGARTVQGSTGTWHVQEGGDDVKEKTLVIAYNYQAFRAFIAATCKDADNYTYIFDPEQLMSYERETPVLKIHGYDKKMFSALSYPMLRMQNQSDFSFESLRHPQRR
jgi:hypothetical protein